MGFWDAPNGQTQNPTQLIWFNVVTFRKRNSCCVKTWTGNSVCFWGCVETVRASIVEDSHMELLCVCVIFYVSVVCLIWVDLRKRHLFEGIVRTIYTIGIFLPYHQVLSPRKVGHMQSGQLEGVQAANGLMIMMTMHLQNLEQYLVCVITESLSQPCHSMNS